MKMRIETIRKINKGDLDAESTMDLALSNAQKIKEKVLQKWFKKGTSRDDKTFNEFLLIELTRSVLGAEPRCFYVLWRVSRRFRSFMDLKYLDNLERYKYFKRKLKNLKKRIKEISKRNLNTEGDENFVLDDFIVNVDLNRYKNGKKIKEGRYDSEFVHSTAKGTVVGFRTTFLFNLDKFAPRKLEIYPIKTSTKEIWDETVCKELGTKQGKKKTVIADGGFFAYDNYLRSANHWIESIINPRSNCRENLKEKLDNFTPRLELFDIHDQEKIKNVMSKIKDLTNSIKEKSLNYDDYKKKRSTIEHIFKIAKEIFGIKDLHVYDKEGAYPKVFIGLFFSCLLYQSLDEEGINIDRAEGLLADNMDVW